MRKLKILIADPFEALGGEEEVAYYIYNGLDRNKYKVFITGNNHSKYFSKHSPRSEEIISIFPKGKTNFKEMRRFRKIIKEYEIDLINVHGYSAGFFVRVACFGLKNVKIIWTMHTNVEDMFKNRPMHRLISTYVEKILNGSYLFTDCIITVCEDSKNKLMKKGESKIPIITIYNGIDIEKYDFVNKKHDSSKELVLGYFSRLSPQKDIPLLLESIKDLIEDNKKVKLIIAGDGVQKDYVIEYITKNHLEQYITFMGFLNDISKQFANIDVLVLPSHYECFPMILIESMCTGTPVIASDVGGVSEIVNNGYNGFLVKAENKKEFIKKIEYYIDNRDKISVHGMNARQTILDKYSKEIMLNQYENVYANTIIDS